MTVAIPVAANVNCKITHVAEMVLLTSGAEILLRRVAHMRLSPFGGSGKIVLCLPGRSISSSYIQPCDRLPGNTASPKEIDELGCPDRFFT